MNSERNIIKRLFESRQEDIDQDLDERTYTVGDTQYWKRGGKCYKWTSAEGRQECTEEDYMKAISGGNNTAVKNTEPKDDKAKTSDTSSDDELINKANTYLNYHLGSSETGAKATKVTKNQYGLYDVEYETSVKVPVYTDPETGVTEYETETEYRTAVVHPKDMGDEEDELIKKMSTKDLKSEIENIRSKLATAEDTGNKSGAKRFQADLDKYTKELKGRSSKKKAPEDVKYDTQKMKHFTDEAIDKLANDEETTASVHGSTIIFDLGDKDLKNEKLISRLKELGYVQTSSFRFMGYNHKD